ncbi:carboxypeptidase 4 [Viridothelium virens]|uniref:Carboxypeptidase n=1 Tax=Viridothelium virens TaxID=1048519 RepID=A0A6A6GV74_VIRVR|nr:carboxypeptidase 4 [Viridothelium virens]
MHFNSFAAALLGISAVAALESPHKKAPVKPKRTLNSASHTHTHRKRQSGHLNSNTAKFAVNGSGIPDVNFNIGESYAGTLPIDGNTSNVNQLWFWFFPSENQAASDEIVIWLNGGPGCSSLDGLFQENGPFLWQSGTYSPIANPYSWVNLTNMVWVDQPIGTGFSPAAPGAPAQINDEVDIGREFSGFWKNFMETFDLVGRKVYITGESYAGQYIPYIANYMLDQNNTDYYNVAGIQINDPSINYDDTLIQAPAVWHLNDYANIFNLNESTMADVNQRAESCGYIQFMENALTFPPTGKLPTAPNSSVTGCDVWDDIIAAAVYINPCFNIYHLIDYCPYLWDQLGFPSLGWGPNDYFNRSDVQRAINAPPTDYTICGDPTLFPKGDQSVPSSLGPIPSVIERTNNVIIGHGWLDYLLLANGTLASIQNMTWNGLQGFQTRPSDNFFVPYHPGLAEILYEIEYQPIPASPAYNVAGAGFLGTTHTERGLTFVTVNHAGHEIPQYVPGASYRQLEFLLGRISSLTQQGDFTTQNSNYTGTTPPSRRAR